jgi:hypothetical protein
MDCPFRVVERDRAGTGGLTLIYPQEVSVRVSAFISSGGQPSFRLSTGTRLLKLWAPVFGTCPVTKC